MSYAEGRSVQDVSAQRDNYRGVFDSLFDPGDFLLGGSHTRYPSKFMGGHSHTREDGGSIYKGTPIVGALYCLWVGKSAEPLSP